MICLKCGTPSSETQCPACGFDVQTVRRVVSLAAVSIELEPRCSFCGQTEKACGRLHTGLRGVTICNTCVNGYCLWKPTLTVGSSVRFGTYDWRILKIRNNEALIITEKLVRKLAYNAVQPFLGGAFLHHFNPHEQDAMVETVRNNNTKVKVFLLSYEEALRHFRSDVERITKHKGTNTSWWLSGDVSKHGHAQHIRDNGSFCWGGILNSIGVRPALWLKLD